MNFMIREYSIKRGNVILIFYSNTKPSPLIRSIGDSYAA